MKILNDDFPESTREFLTNGPPTLFSGEMNLQTNMNSAGKIGQVTGALLETITESIITGVQDRKFELTKKPKYIDYMGLSKGGDFKIRYGMGTIHIECKQLSDFGSHLEKISYILFNLYMNSYTYGKEFWLVYDHNDNLTNSQYDKLEKLEVQFRILQDKLVNDGVYIDMIPINALHEKLEELKTERSFA